MGNSNGTTYTIEKFVQEFHMKKLEEINSTDLRKKLESLCILFLENPKAFIEFKAHDVAAQGIEEKVVSLKDMDRGEEVELEENELKADEASKTKLYCYIISRLMASNSYQKEDLKIYLSLVTLMDYLVDEIWFVRFFMKNSIDNLGTIIIKSYIKYANSEFIAKAIDLIGKIQKVIINDQRLVAENLIGIGKIMILPKALSENTFTQFRPLRMAMIKIFRLNILLMANLFEDSKNPKHKYAKEYADIVKNTLNDYNSTKIIQCLAESLAKEEPLTAKEKKERDEERLLNKESYQLMIIQSFKYMCKIRIAITGEFFQSDKGTDFIDYIYSMLDNPLYQGDEKLLHEIVLFLINFYIASFNEEALANFKSLKPDDPRHVLIVDKLYNLFKSSNSDEIKFFVGCLFLCISVINDIWDKLKSLNVIKITSKFILKYIFETFSNKTPLSDEESNLTFKTRVSKIWVLLQIFKFIADDLNFKKIYHLDFFKTYFDIVVMLLYINYPPFRSDILKVMNVYTYYTDCKYILLKEKNKRVIAQMQERLDELFTDLQDIETEANNFTAQYKQLKEQDQYQSGQLTTSGGQAKEGSSGKDKNTSIEENTRIVGLIVDKIKGAFYRHADEFGLRISIFTNLMMTNEYEENIKKLCMGKEEEYFQFADEEVSRSKMMPCEFKVGRFVKYIDFFNKVEFLQEDLAKNGQQQNLITNRFVYYLPLALLIYNPLAQIKFENFRENQEDKHKSDLFTVKNFHELIKTYVDDYDILHKLLYAIHRFFCKQEDYREVFDPLKRIIDEISKILSKDHIPAVVSRECLRLLCILTSKTDNTFLWLKFDSNKIHVDYSNFNDVVLKYKDENLNREYLTINDKKQEDQGKTDKIIFLPYLKVKPYADQMGVIFHSNHHLLLPKSLHLETASDTNFTVWFRFFNPVINTKQWHTLLQDPSGLISLIAIDKSKKRIGCFTEDGDFIDSGIDLAEEDYLHKWVQIAMAYRCIKRGRNNALTTDLKWYINGKPLAKSGNDQNIGSSTRKIILPTVIQYIGNSRDFKEPFGIFCDLRIYKAFKDDGQIKALYEAEEGGNIVDKGEYDIINQLYNRVAEKTIKHFVENQDTSEESLFFYVKFFNNLMINQYNRRKFIDYVLILKLLENLKIKKMEIKKEISKFLITIS